MLTEKNLQVKSFLISYKQYKTRFSRFTSYGAVLLEHLKILLENFEKVTGETKYEINEVTKQYNNGKHCSTSH